jgi:hypothetical protein
VFLGKKSSKRTTKIIQVYLKNYSYTCNIIQSFEDKSDNCEKIKIFSNILKTGSESSGKAFKDGICGNLTI